jgi:hypothetical protein
LGGVLIGEGRSKGEIAEQSLENEMLGVVARRLLGEESSSAFSGLSRVESSSNQLAISSIVC